MRVKKSVGRFIVRYVKKMPVVESGALELFVVDSESHRLNKMKLSSGCGAGPCYVSGILWDLGLNEHYVKIIHMDPSFPEDSII